MVASCDLAGRDISDESFDPGVGWDDLRLDLAHDVDDRFFGDRCVLSRSIEVVEWGIGDHGGWVKFDFVRFDKRIAIRTDKRLDIFFCCRAVESWHKVARKLESIASHKVERIADLLDAVSAFVGIQYIVKHRLDTDLQSCDASLASLTAGRMRDVFGSCLDSEADDSVCCCFVDAMGVFHCL